MPYRYFQNFIGVLEQDGELKRIASTFAVAGAVLLLTSCGTTGQRISQHPEIYQRLSPQDQASVSQGQIRLGMTMDAVWLAWGIPEQKIPGYERGHPTETWVYLRYETPPSLRRAVPLRAVRLVCTFRRSSPTPSKGVTFSNGRVVFFRHLPSPPPLGW